ncbi:hypothetical protein BC349_10815 [Flavihumibacter stibioxidans]|uniref:Polysaccharide export outer membrane protein n=2 Tax=Flavihumibacter stibioxidans TaxID=1834163 RepID=A0ABR7MAD8_9BACT|nr:hypothetical protein [Flavihumibacter stibioxidans]
MALTCTTLFSCSSLQKTSTAKTLDIVGAGVLHFPVVADLDVRETKVSGTKAGTISTSLDLMKMEAIAAALKSGNADVLIEPAYQIDTEGSRVTVTVTGWPANYKNFRKMTAADTTLIRPTIMQKPVIVDPVPVKKKRKGAAILAGIGAGALIATGAIIAADNY